MVLKIIGSFMLEYTTNGLTDSLSSFAGISELDIYSASNYISNTAVKILILTLPVGIAAVLISIILTATQTKLLVNFSQLKPRFSELNPLTGLKKMFSAKTFINLIKSIILITVSGCIIYARITEVLPEVTKTINTSIAYSLFWICETVFNIVLYIGLFMTGFGVLDYFYQWWDYERRLRMTKQEIKEEYKQTEGNPEIKGKIKERQRRLASMRMMEKVPQADVVIRNPTHYAVALEYKPGETGAPVVVAKGRDYLALKIIELAEKNNVPVTENRPLARGLYEAVEIDEEIPEEFYKAVADILAFIFNMKKDK